MQGCAGVGAAPGEASPRREGLREAVSRPGRSPAEVRPCTCQRLLSHAQLVPVTGNRPRKCNRWNASVTSSCSGTAVPEHRPPRSLAEGCAMCPCRQRAKLLSQLKRGAETHLLRITGRHPAARSRLRLRFSGIRRVGLGLSDPLAGLFILHLQAGR